MTIVTLTGFPDIFRQFQRSVERCEPAARKIVVTSGKASELTPSGWTILRGAEPFVFARNANQGIAAAAPEDVFLVNDDVQFSRLNSLMDLEVIAEQDPAIGIVSPQFSGQVGNVLQHQRISLQGTTLSDCRLAFTAVLLRRRMIDAIGLLDEDFIGYGCEDDDYCLRAQNAGWKLAVTPRVLMHHGYGRDNATASFNRRPGLAQLMEEARMVFEAKHGRRP